LTNCSQKITLLHTQRWRMDRRYWKMRRRSSYCTHYHQVTYNARTVS